MQQADGGQHHSAGAGIALAENAQRDADDDGRQERPPHQVEVFQDVLRDHLSSRRRLHLDVQPELLREKIGGRLRLRLAARFDLVVECLHRGFGDCSVQPMHGGR